MRNIWKDMLSMPGFSGFVMGAALAGIVTYSLMRRLEPEIAQIPTPVFVQDYGDPTSTYWKRVEIWDLGDKMTIREYIEQTMPKNNKDPLKFAPGPMYIPKLPKARMIPTESQLENKLGGKA